MVVSVMCSLLQNKLLQKSSAQACTQFAQGRHEMLFLVINWTVSAYCVAHLCAAPWASQWRPSHLADWEAVRHSGWLPSMGSDLVNFPSLWRVEALSSDQGAAGRSTLTLQAELLHDTILNSDPLT
jgi:hypothetical protein